MPCIESPEHDDGRELLKALYKARPQSRHVLALISKILAMPDCYVPVIESYLLALEASPRAPQQNEFLGRLERESCR